MFENILLKNMFRSGRDEGTGGCIIHDEEIHDFSSSENTIRVIKSRRIKWAGHVTCKGEKRKAYMVLVGKPKEGLAISI